jgi:hypothetical protein
MVNHGISTGALFLLVGVIYDRRHTRDLAEFGGLAKVMPWYAALVRARDHELHRGLPGTNGFVGEFLIITGTFTADCCAGRTLRRAPAASRGHGPALHPARVSGVVLGAVYMLDVTQKVFFGPAKNPKNEGPHGPQPREWQALAPAGPRDLRHRPLPDLLPRAHRPLGAEPSSRSTTEARGAARPRHAPRRTRGSSTRRCSRSRVATTPRRRPRTARRSRSAQRRLSCEPRSCCFSPPILILAVGGRRPHDGRRLPEEKRAARDAHGPAALRRRRRGARALAARHPRGPARPPDRGGSRSTSTVLFLEAT